MANQYISATDYTAVAQWTATTAYTVGNIVRQRTTPTAGFERCFACTTAGTTGASEPLWSTTSAARSSTWPSGTATFTECTGLPQYNGDGGGTAWGAPYPNCWVAFYTLNPTFQVSGGYGVQADVYYAKSTHNYVYQSAPTIYFGGGNSPVYVISVNPSTTIPPPAGQYQAGATESTSASIIMTHNGYGGIIQGFTFKSGATGGNIVLNGYSQYINCNFVLQASTGTDAVVVTGPSGYSGYGLQLVNSNITLNAVGQTIQSDQLSWTYGSVLGVSPTSLFVVRAGKFISGTIKGVDLSICTGALVNQTSAGYATILFQNCKINASATFTSGSQTNSVTDPAYIKFYNCDSAGTDYRYYSSQFTGTVASSTVYYRNGGASDGTTPFSWQGVTSVIGGLYAPLVIGEFAVWNTFSSGTHTATIYIYTSSTTLNSQNTWIELEYQSDASSPVTSLATSWTGALGTGSALPTDATSTWTGTALTNKYAVSVSFNPLKIGVVRARLLCSQFSTTLYVDPAVYVT